MDDVRPVSEIQEAHDLLNAIAHDQIPNVYNDEKAMVFFRAYAGCLCWILQHDDGDKFDGLLNDIRRRLVPFGMVYPLFRRKKSYVH